MPLLSFGMEPLSSATLITLMCHLSRNFFNVIRLVLVTLPAAVIKYPPVSRGKGFALGHGLRLHIMTGTV